MDTKKDLFSEHGLKVEYGDPEIGKTYPMYGMITKILKEEVAEDVEVEINFNMRIKMNFTGDFKDKLNKIKERSLEPGIFIVNVIKKYDSSEHSILGKCSTVIFGKKEYEQVN